MTNQLVEQTRTQLVFKNGNQKECMPPGSVREPDPAPYVLITIGAICLSIILSPIFDPKSVANSGIIENIGYALTGSLCLLIGLRKVTNNLIQVTTTFDIETGEFTREERRQYTHDKTVRKLETFESIELRNPSNVGQCYYVTLYSNTFAKNSFS